jgi:tRNA threonylcarbamoyladenosine dehydratase
MKTGNEIFQRTELLLGNEFIEKAASKRVIIFGLGGVGSWCAETLVRSGIGHLTLVDSDLVSTSNINRQLMATTKTVGLPKVDVLRERLLEINPEADIIALQKIYGPETHDYFSIESFHFIIDAIDSLSNKIYLIQKATQTEAFFVSSMGAALKTDPSKIKVAEFWQVQGCRLGAALRKRITRSGGIKRKFLCVYSDESFVNKGDKIVIKKSENELVEGETLADNWSHRKACINGTTSYMPAMFGMTITSLIMKAIMEEIHGK